MNILAFVIGILMIFALTTNTLFKKRISDDILSNSFSGYMVASRKAYNESEIACFKNIRTKPIEKKPPLSTSNTNSNANEKSRNINSQYAKINIYPLVFEKKENHKELYKLTASMIKTLYSNQVFYTNRFEYQLLDNIILAFQNQIKKKKELNFANLTLRKQNTQKNYYRILKGTKFYDFEKKTGTPSLLDFVKFENSKLKIPMKDASKELLVSCFNENIANEIQILQKQKNLKNLTKTAVLDICQKRHFKIDEKVINFFDFSNRINIFKEKIFVGIDKKTQIKVTRKVTT